MAVYTRKELAEKTGFGFDALRYYEGRGILPSPDRSPGNYRLYGEDAVERLLFIKQAKLCGFTLKEIARALDLIGGAGACGPGADEVIDGKIGEIGARIVELEKMKSMLIAAKAALKDRDCGDLGSYRLDPNALDLAL
jgi:MerR family transcriptional regulator, Zn(II)-responsive regulator of zntA